MLLEISLDGLVSQIAGHGVEVEGYQVRAFGLHPLLVKRKYKVFLM